MRQNEEFGPESVPEFVPLELVEVVEVEIFEPSNYPFAQSRSGIPKSVPHGGRDFLIHQ